VSCVDGAIKFGVHYLICVCGLIKLHVTSRGGWRGFNCRVRVRDNFLEEKNEVESGSNCSRHTFDLTDFDSDERPLSPIFGVELFFPVFLTLLALAPGVFSDC
jgi:hypothetical protein